MQITPPFGYSDITPLLKNHRVSLNIGDAAPAFARATNALPITMSEIPVAGHQYPIVFSSSDGGKTFAMVAIMGMTAGENLFIDGEAWAPGCYIPAYVRRYPFCMTRVTVESVEQSQRIICIEANRLADDGKALFNDAGEPEPGWIETEKFLQEFEADLDRSREMCAILADYKLLEPFTMQAKFDIGGDFHLTGMYRVDEKRFEYLTSGEIKNLLRKGILGRAYQHLASLSCFNQLIDRKGKLLLKAAPAAAEASPTTSTAPADIAA